jgi:hypothetical protein
MVFVVRSSALMLLLSLVHGSGQAAQPTSRAVESRTSADADTSLAVALSSARVAEPQRLAAVLTGAFKLEPGGGRWLADLR